MRFQTSAAEPVLLHQKLPWPMAPDGHCTSPCQPAGLPPVVASMSSRQPRAQPSRSVTSGLPPGVEGRVARDRPGKVALPFSSASCIQAASSTGPSLLMASERKCMRPVLAGAAQAAAGSCADIRCRVAPRAISALRTECPYRLRMT